MSWWTSLRRHLPSLGAGVCRTDWLGQGGGGGLGQGAGSGIGGHLGCIPSEEVVGKVWVLGT